MKKKVKHLLASACTALFLSTLTAFSAFAELQQGPAYTFNTVNFLENNFWS